MDKFSQIVPNLPEKRSVVLKYDVAYAHHVGAYERICTQRPSVLTIHASDAVITTLESKVSSSTRILHTAVPLTAQTSSSGQHRTLHSLQEADLHACTEEEASPENSVILYIGGESLSLTNLLMTHASYEVRPVFTLHPYMI